MGNALGTRRGSERKVFSRIIARTCECIRSASEHGTGCCTHGIGIAACKIDGHRTTYRLAIQHLAEAWEVRSAKNKNDEDLRTIGERER